MASETILQDIDERFLQCAICLNQLNIPKLLPCAHRYCRNCLDKTIKGRQDDKIQCPTCRETHILPKDGVDGLRTDFNTQSIIEFIQAHNPAASKENKEARECHHNPDTLSNLCCITCGNLPICSMCTRNAHRDHNYEDISKLAEAKRNELRTKLSSLIGYEEQIHYAQPKIVNAKKMLDRMVDEKKQKHQEELEQEEKKLASEISKREAKFLRQKTALEEALKKKMAVREEELETELRLLREKHEKICERERQEAGQELEKLTKENEQQTFHLRDQLKDLRETSKKMMTSLTAQEKKQSTELEEMLDHFRDVMERLEGIRATASSLCTGKHDWTDVQCIPDICSVADKLIEEVTSALLKSDKLCAVAVVNLPLLHVACKPVNTDITEKEESVVEIDGIRANGWSIHSVTSNTEGTIIISGAASRFRSHITTIGRDGKKLKVDLRKSTSKYPHRLCEFVTQIYIISVCSCNEIGVLDIRDGRYVKSEISDIVASWPLDRLVSCVATNPLRNHIIVGGHLSREVYVFSGQQLKFLHTLPLPRIIKWPRDIAFHQGSLLVCDYVGEAAYAVDISGGTDCPPELRYEFVKPDVGGGKWKPCGVCTDKNNCIYMLWVAEISRQPRSIIVQYDRYSGRILTTRIMYENYAEAMTIMEAGQGEKILIPTKHTGELLTYGLLQK